MGLEWDSNGTQMGLEWDSNGTQMGLEWDSNETIRIDLGKGIMSYSLSWSKRFREIRRKIKNCPNFY